MPRFQGHTKGTSAEKKMGKALHGIKTGGKKGKQTQVTGGSHLNKYKDKGPTGSGKSGYARKQNQPLASREHYVMEYANRHGISIEQAKRNIAADEKAAEEARRAAQNDERIERDIQRRLGMPRRRLR